MNIDATLQTCPDGSVALFKGGLPVYCPYQMGMPTKNSLDIRSEAFMQKQPCTSSCANFQIIVNEKKEVITHIRCGAGAAYAISGAKVEEKSSLVKA